ncbi:MAG: hypothetical protein BV459_01555 [Thermoplasmata archaeon M11B2D]|nr:MAG: hypothetical protein BV459_01555 [Thermoplasmata archaeon M11B2D]
MKEKIGILIGLIVAILVLLTLALWMMNLGTLEFMELGSFAIIIFLVAAAFYVLWDRVKNLRKGLPAKDERLLSINYKAGYYGFIAAIWSAVFGPLFIDIIFGYELEGSRVTALVVIVSGIVFIVSYLYLATKGKNV